LAQSGWKGRGPAGDIPSTAGTHFSPQRPLRYWRMLTQERAPQTKKKKKKDKCIQPQGSGVEAFGGGPEMLVVGGWAGGVASFPAMAYFRENFGGVSVPALAADGPGGVRPEPRAALFRRTGNLLVRRGIGLGGSLGGRGVTGRLRSGEWGRLGGPGRAPRGRNDGLAA